MKMKASRAGAGLWLLVNVTKEIHTFQRNLYREPLEKIMAADTAATARCGPGLLSFILDWFFQLMAKKKKNRRNIQLRLLKPNGSHELTESCAWPRGRAITTKTHGGHTLLQGQYALPAQ